MRNEDLLCRLIKNWDEVDLTEDFIHIIDVLSTGYLQYKHISSPDVQL